MKTKSQWVILIAVLIMCVSWASYRTKAHKLQFTAFSASPPLGPSGHWHLKAAGLRAIGADTNGPDTQQLESLFQTAVSAAESVAPGPDGSATRRAIHNERRGELESFATNQPASAWTPSLHLYLGQQAQLRCGYSAALSHYLSAFDSAADNADPEARKVAATAAGAAARLLTLTGRLSEVDALEAETGQLGLPSGGTDWDWARGARDYARKLPDESYRCGLYCLDQLGRRTQPGEFKPRNITKAPYSTNGFSVAELLAIASQNDLRVHATARRQHQIHGILAAGQLRKRKPGTRPQAGCRRDFVA